jgi:hypothetical protein
MKEEIDKPAGNTRAGSHVGGGGISWGRKSIRSPNERGSSVEEERGDREVNVTKMAVGTWDGV